VLTFDFNSITVRLAKALILSDNSSLGFQLYDCLGIFIYSVFSYSLFMFLGILFFLMDMDVGSNSQTQLEITSEVHNRIL
jgi:hypothetical protein